MAFLLPLAAALATAEGAATLTAVGGAGAFIASRWGRKLTVDDQAAYPPPSFYKSMVNHVNIVITGCSGTGKSSLINALRRMLKKHYEAADPAPAGQDGTIQPARYVLPGQPVVRTPIREISTRDQQHLAGRQVMAKREGREERFILGDRLANGWRAFKVETAEVCTLKHADITDVFVEFNLWDLPGYGSDKFPEGEYVKRTGLRYFDMVVLVVGPRQKQYDKEIVRMLKAYRVPCLIVLSKVDSVLEIQEDPEALENIRRTVMNELDAEWVYMVSCNPLHWDNWDLGQLRQHITAPFVPPAVRT